jgi:NitT/TauT family transport system substrate-binding protein
MPIYPDMQHFVMSEEGYYDELEAEVEAKQFTDGPSIVKAYASGQLDVALFGIVPAMIVIDKGIAAQVVAANIKEPMAVMAHHDFFPLWEESEDAETAFAAWKSEKGRPFTFGTFPEGSVPDILLRYWLDHEHDIDPDGSNVVDIKGVGGASAVFSGLASGSIDGTSIMEPVPTKAEAEDLPYDSLAIAPDFMPGQPAAVALMNDEVRNGPLAGQFVRQHRRATEFIKSNPEAAAADASAVIGEQSLPPETAKQAMESPLSNFITDPHQIEAGTEIFADYAARLGKTGEKLAIDDIFDYSVYDDL